MAERDNSRLLNGGEEMGMTDNQYKGFLLSQLKSWKRILALAIESGNTEIQEQVEIEIETLNDMLKF
jgi:hypothetical protein